VKPRVAMWCLAALLGMLVVASGAGGCGTEGTPAGTSAPVSSGTSVTDVPTVSTTATSRPTTTLASTTTRLDPALMLLQDLTLREKAAQVLLLAFEGTTLLPATKALLTENPPGGLLLLARNVTGAEQLASLTAALQNAAVAGGSRVGLLVAADQEGGPVQRIRYGVPSVPAARVLGQDSSPGEAARLAGETATSLLRLGVNMNLAPVADVVSDPQSFLYRRTYAGDPTLVADFVESVAAAYARAGLIAVVKHFPGHGSAGGNTHGEVVLSEATQTEFATTHLVPFKAAFATGVQCVMVSHLVVKAYDPDRPASLSDAVIQGLLREGLGFSGLVIADDLEMAGAAGSETGTAEAAQAGDIGAIAVSALEAGCDLLISTGTLDRQKQMLDAIVAAVNDGRLSRQRLDQAVLHVLALKARYGLTPP